MSHGKLAMLKGKTKKMVSIPAPGKAMSFDFSDEEELGYVPTHGLAGGNPAKAKTSIVSGINTKLAKKWKDLKAAGNAPTLVEADIEFEVYTKK